MSIAPSVRVRGVHLFERAVTLRLPFRFGAATVTHCPQAFVRVLAEVDGRRVVGASAELMVPKWFDKNPALKHAQNFKQLRHALRCAARARPISALCGDAGRDIPRLLAIDGSRGPRVRLSVQAGQLDLCSLHGPGFASTVHPQWDSLQAIS